MSKDIYQEVTDAILAQLEAGVIPWRKPWTSRSGEMPANLKSKKNYRGINQLLLSMMPYSSPWWVTFKQAKELGGCVRKGERSTMVVFYKPLVKRDATDPEKLVMAGRVLKYYNVFNAEQCDGLTVPVQVDRVDFDPIEAAADLVNGYVGAPPVNHGGDSACWIPAWDVVKMPHPEDFTSGAAYYSTLFHEFTHSTGHANRLDRWSGVASQFKFGSDPYGREELVAEMGAAMMMAHAGLFPEIAQESASYIGSWIKTLRGEPKLVLAAAGKAQRACDHMMGVSFEEKTQEQVAIAA